MQVSDKNLTQESGFLQLLNPGDTILADHGFTIDGAVHGAKLRIPSFTRGKKQLSQREVEQSQQLARVRTHVERIIGLMKNKFTILKGPLSVNLLKHKQDEDDKILNVLKNYIRTAHASLIVQRFLLKPHTISVHTQQRTLITRNIIL